MDWEYWKTQFKKYLPSDYVDAEIDHYQKVIKNRDVWPDEQEAVEAYTYMFNEVLKGLKGEEKH